MNILTQVIIHFMSEAKENEMVLIECLAKVISKVFGSQSARSHFGGQSVSAQDKFLPTLLPLHSCIKERACADLPGLSHIKAHDPVSCGMGGVSTGASQVFKFHVIMITS